MFKTFVILFIIIFSNYIYADNSCKNNNFNKELTLATNDNIDIKAKNYSIKNNIHTYWDNVNLITKDINLTANKLILDRSSDVIVANDINFHNNSVITSAVSMTAIKYADDYEINLIDADYQLFTKTINGSTDNLYINNNTLKLKKATYSTCVGDNKFWLLEADKIGINIDDNKGTATNVFIKIMSVPVFYTPKLSWTLTGRQSGFLSPEFNSFDNADTKTNYQLIVPYYFNIAPDRDLILSLNNITNIGVGVNYHYRQLLTTGNIDALGTYFANDEIQDKQRWLANIKSDFNIIDNIKLNTQIYRVSDKDFFLDVQSKVFNEKTLDSHINIHYQKDNTIIGLTKESQQIIAQQSVSYYKAPELYMQQDYNIAKLALTLGLNSTKFISGQIEATHTNTVRSHYSLMLNNTIWRDFYNITPEFNIYHTTYNIAKDDNQQRTIANVNFDTKWNFANNTSLLQHKITNILTPRLFYNYTTKKNQELLPNFDSEQTTQNYQSLFSIKTLTGVDRFLAANNISLGLDYNLVDADNGDIYTNISIAQAFYQKSEYNPTENSLKHSNIIINNDNYIQKHKINFNLHYNPDDGSLVENHIEWQYNSTADNFTTIAHHTVADGKYLEIYTAENIINNIKVFAGLKYDINAEIYNKATLGITYDNCCWSFKFANFRSYNSNNNYNNSFNMQLNLRDLFNSTPDFNNSVRDEIPQYY